MAAELSGPKAPRQSITKPTCSSTTDASASSPIREIVRESSAPFGAPIAQAAGPKSAAQGPKLRPDVQVAGPLVRGPASSARRLSFLGQPC